jgi:hypothetical protein
MSFEVLSGDGLEDAVAGRRPVRVPEPVAITDHPMCRFIGKTLRRAKTRKPMPVRTVRTVQRRYMDGFGVTTAVGFTVPGDEAMRWMLVPAFRQWAEGAAVVAEEVSNG